MPMPEIISIRQWRPDIWAIAQKLDRIIESYLRVTGGEQYLSPDVNKVLQKGEKSGKSIC
jgi:hypothetical protein